MWAMVRSTDAALPWHTCFDKCSYETALQWLTVKQLKPYTSIKSTFDR